MRSTSSFPCSASIATAPNASEELTCFGLMTTHHQGAKVCVRRHHSTARCQCHSHNKRQQHTTSPRQTPPGATAAALLGAAPVVIRRRPCGVVHLQIHASNASRAWSTPTTTTTSGSSSSDSTEGVHLTSLGGGKACTLLCQQRCKHCLWRVTTCSSAAACVSLSRTVAKYDQRGEGKVDESEGCGVVCCTSSTFSPFSCSTVKMAAGTKPSIKHI